jgi:pimeloyl-ACP methyl ester carboxylesterase
MNLHVDAKGAGTPAILLHSSGSSGRQWRRLADALVERKHVVVVPDLTGHGASAAWPADAPFHFHRDVEEVVALLDAQSEPAHVVGHSYGGLIALQATMRRPAKVRSLAVYDPVAFGALDRARDADVVAQMNDVRRAFELSEAEFVEAFVDFWGGPGAWHALREEVRAEMRRTAFVVRAGVSSLALDETPAHAYSVFTGPALLMRGQSSPVPARRVIERLAEAMARAHVVDVDGAAHFGPITHAAATNAFILEHIARAERDVP